MTKKHLFLTFLFFILFYNSAFTQVKGLKQPIILEYADSLVGTRGHNMDIREFVGNVVLKQGDVTVKCDHAIQYLNSNKAILTGNVHINQKELDLYTPRGIYYGNSHIASSSDGLKITDHKTILTAKEGTYSVSTRIADFHNNVIIEDDSVIIFADRVIYHKSNQNSFAYGNVMIHGKYSNTYLFGDTLEHYPGKNITLIRVQPTLFQIDTVSKTHVEADTLTDDRTDIENDISDRSIVALDTMSVKARFMKSFVDKDNNKEIFYFLDSVEIRQKELAAKADTAIYYKSDGIIKLSGVPVVWYDSTQLYSDSIIILAPDMKIKELRAIGNSIACSRGDTTDLRNINQVVGDEIIIKFANDTINAIFSFGNAKSLYFMTEDSSGAGLQTSSCDTIAVYFDEGEIDEINWLGGINGEFYPVHLVVDPKSFYLPGFKWSDIKPEKHLLIINRKKE
jgi:lipopolysaccharide assembly outer membrane protein LptD (OstA)